jgi:hypothetical protein
MAEIPDLVQQANRFNPIVVKPRADKVVVVRPTLLA